MHQIMLIVDDSWVTRKVIRSSIKKLRADWDFVEAESGEEALAKIESIDISLAAVDYHMPGMTGLDLIPKLRTKFTGIPVFLVTAARSNIVRKEAAAMGVNLLNKPFSLERINACLESLGLAE